MCSIWSTVLCVTSTKSEGVFYQCIINLGDFRLTFFPRSHLGHLKWCPMGRTKRWRQLAHLKKASQTAKAARNAGGNDAARTPRARKSLTVNRFSPSEPFLSPQKINNRHRRKGRSNHTNGDKIRFFNLNNCCNWN